MDRPTKLAFVDTETTGLSHLSRPWEIAVILRETPMVDVPYLGSTESRQLPGETAEREHVMHVRYGLMSLPDGSEPSALEMNGWYDRGHGEESAQYLHDLDVDGVKVGAGAEFAIANWLHKLLQGATLVGVGVHYDAEVLGRMFLRHGLDWHPWHYAIRDLKSMTDGYLRGYDPRACADAGFRSEALSEAVGVKPPTDEERHTALGDARWAARWYDAL